MVLPGSPVSRSYEMNSPVLGDTSGYRRSNSPGFEFRLPHQTRSPITKMSCGDW
ncbi:MAG: hypothetical protein ACYTKD_13800 [Planctomycetota bacterium]|jgi:hypothetical protein